MIRLSGISRTFQVGDAPVHALLDINEEIVDGEHLAIMGPSGSGKSTLLHILGCLDRPDQGTYELLGREVGGLDEGELSLVRRHTIGFVFQFFHLVPRLTALENVELPMVFAGASSAKSAVSGPWVGCKRWGSSPGPIIVRISSRVASGSGWPSPGRPSSTRSCFSPTSRRATSMPRRVARCSACSPR